MKRKDDDHESTDNEKAILVLSHISSFLDRGVDRGVAKWTGRCPSPHGGVKGETRVGAVPASGIVQDDHARGVTSIIGALMSMHNTGSNSVRVNGRESMTGGQTLSMQYLMSRTREEDRRLYTNGD